MTLSSSKSQSGLQRILSANNRKGIIVLGIDEKGKINVWNENISDILGKTVL